MQRIFKFSSILILLFMTACANNTTNKNIYQWGDYPNSLYGYMTKNMESQKQIEILEGVINSATEAGKRIPPGAYAQLGLVYSNLGDTTSANRYFQLEKETFPESAHYIDFLTKKSNIVKRSH